MTHDSDTPISLSPVEVLWPQVWGLALVQGAISLTWVIYTLYLVDLLESVGLPGAWARGVVIGENLLGIGMEPLMGSCSDRVQRWVGSRFPFVAGGVILASVCFVLIPFTAGALAARVPADLAVAASVSVVQWILPGVLVAWALAMAVFRSPALSLLGRYAIGTQLPQAASILTLVGGVAGAMGPLANQRILALGPTRAFLMGSIVLVVAALVLRSVGPGQSISEAAETGEVGVAKGERASGDWSQQSEGELERLPESESFSGLGLGLVFGAGVGVALGFRLMMGMVPQILVQRLPTVNVGLILGLIFVALAVSAIPAGNLGAWLGNRLAMMLGLGAMAVLLAACLLLNTTLMAMVLAVGLGGSFSLVSNGTIPFALSMVPARKAGLGTGIFFSGGAAATSLFGAVFAQSEVITPGVGIGFGVVAFLGAGICIFISTLFGSLTPTAGLDGERS